MHITGLCSDGGVHSHIDHLLGLIKWASEVGIEKVAIHVITDGRDTPAKSASNYIKQIEDCIKKFKVGEIASICGRYWIMDRNLLWERTEKAFINLTDPSLTVTDITAQDYINKSYGENITDESVRMRTVGFASSANIVAGGIIPDRDRSDLHKSGVRAVFGPGTSTSDILHFLEEVESRKNNGHEVGVGQDPGWHWN